MQNKELRQKRQIDTNVLREGGKLPFLEEEGGEISIPDQNIDP
jgi:hypothetical protein